MLTVLGFAAGKGRMLRFTSVYKAVDSSYRCKEKRITYHSDYWYKADSCQYHYCNSWSSAQLQVPSRCPT
ncbi:lymphocyte antigen 6 complex locus protein G5b [Sigmodon hispidus]